MTNSWTDIKNADVVLIMGSNTAENHPLGMKHVQNAVDKGATVINVDPRFCRSSSRAHIHAYMRSGTDIAFLGGIIHYAIEQYEADPTKGINEKYVKECTNALLKLNSGFETCEEGTIGVFSGFTAGTYDSNLEATLDSSYTKTTWEYDSALTPTVASDLTDTACVFQKLKKQFQNYTKDNVCAITGTDPDVYEEICEKICDTRFDDKSMTILYAMGTTQHTVGTQNIRAYSILQLLLGNIGVAGGGINALRGQNNVQGSTDQAVLQHILPGYLKVPTPAQTTLTLYNNGNYNAAQAVNPTHSYTVRGNPVDPISVHWWKNGTKYIASLLKAWWPAINHNTSYTYLSKKAATEDFTILSMFDEIHAGNIKGAIFIGENPAVSDPDSEHVRETLGHLDWLVCVDPFESETAAFWKRPGVTPGDINTTVYLLPCAVGIEKWGSFSNSSRWAQWAWAKSGVNPPGEARSDMDIIVDLGTRLKGLISDAQVANLNWPCFNYTGQTEDALAELIAKEMNGYNLSFTTPTTGTHNGGNDQTSLIDTTKDFVAVGVQIGDSVRNTTDGCQGFVTSITTTTSSNDTLNFSEGLSGGVGNDFDTGDAYVVRRPTSTTGTLLNSFITDLQNDGTTACGNWLHCHAFVNTMDAFETANTSAIWSAGGGVAGSVNRAKRRYPADVGNAGYTDPNKLCSALYSYWSWCWPVNRRIVYNRAAMYLSDGTPFRKSGDTSNGLAGDPLAPNKYVLKWNGTAFSGDVVDGGGNPVAGAWPYPFIMNKDGHGHVFGGWTMAEGPFPWHYEPAESPIPYPSWLGQGTGVGSVRMNPIVHKYTGSAFAPHNGGNDTTYPIYATTYRLTEHYHTGTMTRNTPRLNELQPEPFVEMSWELAGELGIANGELVNIYSARNPSEPVQMKACVTKRFKPFQLNGNTVHQVGVIWHWGYMGLSTGDSGNVLTPYIGDANMRIPESKAFRVKIEKVVP